VGPWLILKRNGKGMEGMGTGKLYFFGTDDADSTGLSLLAVSLRIQASELLRGNNPPETDKFFGGWKPQEIRK